MSTAGKVAIALVLVLGVIGLLAPQHKGQADSSSGSAASQEKPAGPTFDRKIILESLGVEKYRKYTEEESVNSGVMFDGYTYGEPGPTVSIEFKSDRINIAIQTYPESGYEEKNVNAIKMAKIVVSTITGSDRDLVQEMLDGEIKGKLYFDGISCNAAPPMMGMSMLTFYYQ